MPMEHMNEQAFQHLMEASKIIEERSKVEPSDHRFTRVDGLSAEVETLEFLAAFIRRLKPETVIECGTYRGISSVYMGKALKKNNSGHLHTIERDLDSCQLARQRLLKNELSEWVTVLNGSTATVTLPTGPYGIIFHDASRKYDELRAEFERFTTRLENGGFAFIHDSTFYESDESCRVRENCADFAAQNGLVHMSIPSARGLEILHRP